jgi:hypothetical protein
MPDAAWQDHVEEWKRRVVRDEEADELYVLRREFGISAHEAEHVIPDWELATLLERHRHHIRKA